mgnify:FL=1
MTFDRFILALIGAAVTAVILLAAELPINKRTHAPKAVFLSPDAVPEITSLEKSRRKSLTSNTLFRMFARIKYDFNTVQAGQVPIPRLFVKKLPGDMRRIKATKDRKKLFILSVLPLILRVNDEIWAERKKLIKLKKLVKNRIKLSTEDRLWLDVVEDRYKVVRGDFGALELGMDIIPPSLALAQAAEESGWGTSRFVVEGNALFGQWTNNSKSGLIPLGRGINRNYRVQAFRSLLDGVRAYARNLNTHRAYRSFRVGRSELRRSGKILSGQKLSLHLASYSERGESYVRSLQKIITSNSLEKFDHLKLGDRNLRVIERIIS